MTDIMMVFACLNQSLHPTTLHQLRVVAVGGYPFNTGQLEYGYHCSKCPKGLSLAAPVAEA